MDWFLQFFQRLLFLSPSRWMVIAPPALIMCWIGKKTGGKRFYGNCESILLEVYCLLQLCFIYPSQKPTLPCTETYACAPALECMTAALIALMASRKIGQKIEGNGENGGEKVKEWGACSHLAFRVLAEAGDWEKDNCFIKCVIAITSVILHEQRAFHHSYLM